MIPYIASHIGAFLLGALAYRYSLKRGWVKPSASMETDAAWQKTK
jgi:hypothetical protein